MDWLIGQIKWVMLLSGVLTCTMVYALIAPQAALQTMFATQIEGPAAEIIVRNWGALITLVGGMLIYGAFHRASRPLVRVVAGLSKLCFIGLVLAYGSWLPGHQLGIGIGIDMIMVVVFVTYLVLARHELDE